MYQYNNPYMQYIPQQQMPVQRQQIIQVNGMGGAQAYQMMPNSSALLLDENNPLLYLAQTDGAGYKTVTTFKIEAYNPEPQATPGSLEERIRKLEEVIYHGKSNSSEDQQKPENTESGGTAGDGSASGWKPAADI